jgi:hypothetical protein
MPVRTRSDMHIGLDLVLQTLNATPSNRFDPAAKDYFLNTIITEFVNNVINKANKPDEDKRVPFRILTHGDILSKYNDIYTLIKVDDTVLPTLPATDNNYYIYTLPSDLFRFEASYAYVRPYNCITYRSASAPTLALGSAGNVDNGIHKYFVTFVYGTTETDIVSTGVSSITVTDKATAGQVNITGIPLGSTGCTARKIYRTVAGGNWYNAKLVTTISDNVTTSYVDNTADSGLGVVAATNLLDTQLPNVLTNTYDIISFNNNPFGGQRKYIGTILSTNGLHIYHLNRYAINRIGVIYIKKPAILTSSPTVVNCDLPESTHDTIITNTAKFIAAAVSSGNYEQLLMEAKLNEK